MWFLPSQVFEKVSKVLLWMRLLASFCKTVRNSLLRLDLVCLGSVAKLLQPKSFAQGFQHQFAQPTALAQKQMKRWGCVALHGDILYTRVNMPPPLHAILKQKNHLPRHVRGSVYKGGAVSRSTICLLGLGADCLLFFFGSRILEKLFCAFYHSKSFQKSSCGCVFPFGFLL